MLHFDILDDLSEELDVRDFYHFLSINELSYELVCKTVRRIEYYYATSEWIKLHEKCCEFDTPISHMCYYSDLEALKWVYFNKGEGYFDKMDVSGASRLDVAMWFCENIKIQDLERLFIATCWNGYIDIAMWVYDSKLVEPDKQLVICVFYWATRKGHLDIAKWLYQKYNDIKLIKYAHSNPMCVRHPDVLEWLIETIKNDK